MMSFAEFIGERVGMRQRSGRSRAMIRSSKKIQLKRKLAAKKRAPLDKLMLRAEKQARTLVRNKLAGQDYMSLSQSQKILVDRKMETKKAKIKLLAKKLLPKVKEAEEKRLLKLKNKEAETA